MDTSLIIALIIGLLLLIIVVWVIGAYNGFVAMRNRAEEAFSTMDVFLKKRYDLIPNLVESVKGYAAHESSTFQKVTEARNMASGATTVEGRIQGENMLSGALKSLFAVAEAYPDLKANLSFLDLQNQLKQVEEDIANARKFYNAVVKEFNTLTEVFPNNVLANLFGFKRKPMFEVTGEDQREAVQVKF
ncbi:MAG: LemA family protein [Eubacteriales bacterium]